MVDSIKDKKYYENNYYSSSNLNYVSHQYDSRLHRYRIRKVLEIYTPRSDEIVVDLGCAWGTFCFALAPVCQRIIGIDFSEKVLQLCTHRTDIKTNMNFLCADGQNTGLKSDTVNTIISADLFEHLYPDQFEAILDECKRVLKPGGKLIVWTPHRGHLIEIFKNNNFLLKKDPAHIDYKSLKTMKKALEMRGFSIEKSYYTESHLPIFRFIEQILLPMMPIFRRRIAILAQKQQY